MQIMISFYLFVYLIIQLLIFMINRDITFSSDQKKSVHSKIKLLFHYYHTNVFFVKI